LLSNFALNSNLCRYSVGSAERRVGHHILWGAAGRGGAVQLEPMKPTLKPPGSERMKVRCDDVLSNFALTFQLRLYNAVRNVHVKPASRSGRLSGGRAGSPAAARKSPPPPAAPAEVRPARCCSPHFLLRLRFILRFVDPLSAHMTCSNQPIQYFQQRTYQICLDSGNIKVIGCLIQGP